MNYPLKKNSVHLILNSLKMQNWLDRYLSFSILLRTGDNKCPFTNIFVLNAKSGSNSI